jgi:hypothetical protein
MGPLYWKKCRVKTSETSGIDRLPLALAHKMLGLHGGGEPCTGILKYV